jgi:hypothetical protein
MKEIAMFTKSVGVAAVVFALGMGVAMAQDLVTVDTVGAWTIYVDPTVGNGCLINAEFEDGSDVRIGFDAEAGTGYMVAANAAWAGIEEGVEYPIGLDLDGEVYEGKGVGIVIDDVPGVDIAFDTIDFLMDVAAKQTLTLTNENGPVMSIDLTDSDTALQQAIECQVNQG